MSDQQSPQSQVLACPFCGKEPELRHWTMERLGWVARCTKCELKPETCVYADKDKAIAAWNTRAKPQPTQEAALVEGGLTDAEITLSLGKIITSDNEKLSSEDLFFLHKLGEQARLANAPMRRRTPREWMPIETAPKDGTRVLLFCDKDSIDGDSVFIGSFSVEFRNCWHNDEGYDCINPPTHWQTLPTPPSALKEVTDAE